ncbi:proline--tRNA ligase [Cohnella luojiensis]|uniref:Proline--tRNA ligase n=1 Tax=Cohnella luojiensis TaxID=652876 RepID=A0A4Y8M8V8_9BACL|nr:proline--tRNA ligase [Cohnella luojiensis]TFE31575.1 proline--tRNA ligase [Cohnella luojiensis]
MRQSTLFALTFREAPSDAEAISHQLLLKAGYIRQLAAGVYAYLPLGWRVLRKLEQIIREEMDQAGAQELLMPAMQPIELWKESGRYSVYGPELIRLQDRHEREFALGPTHEEVVTTLVRNEINSYRKLSFTLYQIQTKFRDERRPRYGLLRSREFLMKDAYSFDADWEGLDRSYRNMFEAYRRIFDRCGLNYRAVEADAGSIGGEGGTHEFMALADVGEDTVVCCSECDYAANVEMAEAGSALTAFDNSSASCPMPEEFHTPDLRTIDQLVQSLNLERSRLMKTMIYQVDDKVVAVLVRGDHEVNEIKIKNYMHAETVVIADADTVERVTGAPSGFAGPAGLSVTLLVDYSIANQDDWIAGANRRDHHVRHIRPGRDFSIAHIGDFRNIVEGDSCPRCANGSIQLFKGIEIGHVFKLGTKYSKILNASYLDQEGQSKSMIMGCYGIGVSRLLSAIVEQNHDEEGIKWPTSIAPFHVHIIPISTNDPLQAEIAERLYERFRHSGIEALMDDRQERAGVKFKDSDLMGIPVRIVIGKLANQGLVELKQREHDENETVKIEDVYVKVKDWIDKTVSHLL